MAQLQFRSDDTLHWNYGFGRGRHGNLTISSATNTSSLLTKTTLNGSLDAFTVTVGGESGFAEEDLVLLYQPRKNSAGHGGWMLNKVTATATNQLTLEYPLVQAFVNSAPNIAGVWLLKEYVDIVINSTLTIEAFADNLGGFLPFLFKNRLYGTGTITGSGNGFPGAVPDAGGNSGYGLSGESYFDNDQPSGPTANEGGGGGGERHGADGAGGGGGGHGAGGSSGVGTNAGQGGASYGNASMTLMYMGSGGGAGGGDEDNPGDFTGAPGGDGGALLWTMGRETDFSNMTVTLTGANGTSRSTGSNNGGGGGGGAGGGYLGKGEKFLGLGNVNCNNGNGGTGGNNNSGGNGGDGRTNIDYSVSISGTPANASNNTRNDVSVKGVRRGGFGII